MKLDRCGGLSGKGGDGDWWIWSVCSLQIHKYFSERKTLV